MRAEIETVQRDPDSAFRCFRRVEGSFAFQWHHHRELELTCITAGRGRRFVGDSIEDYREGDLVLLGAELPHTWQSIGKARGGRHQAVVAQFRDDWVGEAFLRLPETRAVRRLMDRAGRGLHFTGPTARRAAARFGELPAARGLDRLIGLLGVLELLSRCQKSRVLSGPDYAPALATRDAGRIDRVVAYVEANLAGEITQARAAKLAHMSPSTFSRFFRRVTGRTFVEYVNDARVSRACRLLIETDLPITTIADRCGYGSLAYFDRRFRRAREMTASGFRRAFAD